MKRLALAAVLGIAAALGAPDAGQAQPPVEARLNAMAFGDIDLSRGIEVRLYDDSRENQRIKQSFVDAVAARGLSTGEDGAFILSFEVHNAVTASATDDPGKLSIVGQTGAYAGGEDYRARLELYNSQTPTQGVAIADGQLRVDVALTEKGTGRRVWQAWVTANSTGRDADQLALSMVPPVVEALGQSVRQQDVSPQ